MGYFCEIRCPDCGYDRQFKLGCGKKDYDQEQVYSHFDMMDVWAAKIDELKTKSGYLTFRYRLGRCADCGVLKEVPEITFEDGSVFYSKQCACDSDCEHEVEFIADEDGEAVSCPDCGKQLIPQRTGLWD